MQKLHPLAVLVTCALSLAGCATAPPQEATLSHAAPRAAAARPPITAEAMYRLGRYHEGQSRFEKAIAAYREALKRDPLLVEAYTGLGMALAARGRYDEAIREFQAAVVLAPDAAYAHNNLGYAYLLSGASGDAVRALEAAQWFDPGHEKVRANLRAARAKVDVKPAAEGVGALSLVEVAPSIFELRARARKIEAVPLAPLPRSFTLEVSNGNGVTGLAKRVAGHLQSAGVRTARLSNQRPFGQARTEVQYREGYAAEAAELVKKLGHPALLVPSNALARDVHVRLVLGKDLQAQALLRSSRRSRA